MVEKLFVFVNSALGRGYKAEHIRAMILEKGWPEKLVDRTLEKVLLDKPRKL